MAAPQILQFPELIQRALIKFQSDVHEQIRRKVLPDIAEVAVKALVDKVSLLSQQWSDADAALWDTMGAQLEDANEKLRWHNRRAMAHPPPRPERPERCPPCEPDPDLLARHARALDDLHGVGDGLDALAAKWKLEAEDVHGALNRAAKRPRTAPTGAEEGLA